MNETLDVIARRSSCRDFNGVMPEDRLLDAVAMAAIQAPSGMNRQHWQIILVRNRGLIAEMGAEGMAALSRMEDKTMYERMLAHGGDLFYGAPCMIVIAIKPAEHPGGELIDCGIVAQNICLAATSLGIDNLHCGLVGLAFAGDRAAEFASRLRFPEGYYCGMAVLLGHADAVQPPHSPDTAKITVID